MGRENVLWATIFLILFTRATSRNLLIYSRMASVPPRTIPRIMTQENWFVHVRHALQVDQAQALPIAHLTWHYFHILKEYPHHSPEHICIIFCIPTKCHHTRSSQCIISRCWRHFSTECEPS